MILDPTFLGSCRQRIAIPPTEKGLQTCNQARPYNKSSRQGRGREVYGNPYEDF
jgi:hypothetical protein